MQIEQKIYLYMSQMPLFLFFVIVYVRAYLVLPSEKQCGSGVRFALQVAHLILFVVK